LGVQASEASITQDAGGRLHVVGPRFTGNGLELDYAYSDDGSTWTTTSIETDATEQDDTRVAAAPDHQGVVVWSDSSSHAIEVAPLGSGATPPPPTTTTPPVTLPPRGPTPAPVFNKTVTATGIGVLVKLKGSSKFVLLSRTNGSIPFGSTIDARAGR